MASRAGLHLVRRDSDPAALAAVLGQGPGAGPGTGLGRRVGLAGVLGRLDRRGRRTLAPGWAVSRAWTWDRADRRDRRWWPQGISTSADALAHGPGPSGTGGRDVVAVTWYAKTLPGDPEGGHGARVSFLDLASCCYAHVLLAVPGLDGSRPVLSPLRVHAGGLVWVGEHLHVAATRRGLVTAHLGDVLEVPDPAATAGHRWVLPVRSSYRAVTDEGVERLRYSFASLDRAGDPPGVLVGEYGRGEQTTRVARFEIDPATGLLRTGEDGTVRPLALDDGRLRGAQGIAADRGTTYVSVSRGPVTPGSLHVGPAGALRERRWALPMGPEDLALWPGRDEVWTVTEHPRRRWVVAVGTRRWQAGAASSARG